MFWLKLDKGEKIHVSHELIHSSKRYLLLLLKLVQDDLITEIPKKGDDYIKLY